MKKTILTYLVSNEIYELGEMINKGRHSHFYFIKNKNNLGVKILFNIDEVVNLKLQLEKFTKEIEIGKYLNRCRVPTPKYVGIIKIKTPKKFQSVVNSDFIYGLVLEIIDDVNVFKIQISNKSKNDNEITIEDVSFREFADYILIKDNLNLQKKIIEFATITLNLLINNTNLNKSDLYGQIDLQGLYSSKEEMFYLIDFDFWK